MHVEFAVISGCICIRIDIKFVNQENIHMCVLTLVIRSIPEQVVTNVYRIQIDGAQNFHAYVCVLISYFRS